MVKIPTVQVGQGNIPEGHYVFKIDSIDDSKYDKFGKLAINLITQDGRKHSERYQLVDSKGNLNEGAQKAWSFFVGSVLDQWGVGDGLLCQDFGQINANSQRHNWPAL